MTASAPALTTDALIGGAVTLTQPADGYRVAMDTVLLAAAVPARSGDRVLDIGAGTGGAALCLARRCPEVTVTGLELQSALIELARRNAALNDLDHRVSFRRGSVTDRGTLDEAPFDHALANPPFVAAGEGPVSPKEGKTAAHADLSARLTDWIEFAARQLRPKGSLTVIHRADRLGALAAAMQRGFGDLTLIPLWPRAGLAAKRIILSGRRGTRGPSRVLPGLVLHGATERYTIDAEAILRGGGSLPLD